MAFILGDRVARLNGCMGGVWLDRLASWLFLGLGGRIPGNLGVLVGIISALAHPRSLLDISLPIRTKFREELLLP